MNEITVHVDEHYENVDTVNPLGEKVLYGTLRPVRHVNILGEVRHLHESSVTLPNKDSCDF